MSAPTQVDWAKELMRESADNNITPYIVNLVGRDLHLKKNHPLNIIKTKIEKVCQCVCDLRSFSSSSSEVQE